MHCVERLFPSHEKLLAQKEMLSFQHPSITVSRTEKGHFIFFFCLFRTGICAQSENQGLLLEISKQETQTQILVPRFTRKQNKKGELTSTFNTKENVILKLHYLFVVKEKRDALRMRWKCVCIFFFLFIFSPFHQWTDWLNSGSKQLGAKTKKQTSIISLCPSFFETATNTRTQPMTSLSAYTTGTVRLSKRITCTFRLCTLHKKPPSNPVTGRAPRLLLPFGYNMYRWISQLNLTRFGEIYS